MHKWVVSAVLVAGVCFLAKKTSFVSYAGTLWSKVGTETKNAIPTKFEIERARHEIAALDKDIAAMIRPIAEYKAALHQLDKDIRQNHKTLSDRREALLQLTRDLEKNPEGIQLVGRTISADKAQAALQRDFEGFQRLERHLETQRKLQEAKKSSFEATQDQLAKLVSKKREFELRLAQLEADEESLQIANLGSKIAFDDNRASAIEAALAGIEHRQDVRRAELELAQGDLVSELLTTTRTPRTDLAGIRGYLERSPAP